MKIALGFGFLIWMMAGLVGCQQEVLSETYRPAGWGSSMGQARPMAGMMPLSGHVMPSQNLPRETGDPWYKFTWLFGKDKPNQPMPVGTPPSLPPAKPVSVGMQNP